jgi:hypothetical protein
MRGRKGGTEGKKERKILTKKINTKIRWKHTSFSE